MSKKQKNQNFVDVVLLVVMQEGWPAAVLAFTDENKLNEARLAFTQLNPDGPRQYKVCLLGKGEVPINPDVELVPPSEPRIEVKYPDGVTFTYDSEGPHFVEW